MAKSGIGSTVTGDFGNSQIFHNVGNGKFQHVTSAVITDENGMGASAADFDNDGDVDSGDQTQFNLRLNRY